MTRQDLRITAYNYTDLGTGTGTGTKFAAQPQSQRQYVKDMFYVILSHNRRKVKIKGVYVDVINIYASRISFRNLARVAEELGEDNDVVEPENSVIIRLGVVRWILNP